jgi:HK97 gp10 family phage protein
MSRSARIEGLKPLLRRLKQLPDRTQRRVLRPAVTKAATPVVKAARKRAPKGTGLTADGRERPHLGRSITKTRAKLSRKTGNVLVMIGPEKDKAPHDHLVHEGTEPHSIVLTKPLQLGRVTLPPGFVIRHPGARSQPFLSEALDATRTQSQSILRRSIAQWIEKQALLLTRR